MVLLLGVSSCTKTRINSTEDLWTTKWSYDKGDRETYTLEFQYPDICTLLVVYHGGAEDGMSYTMMGKYEYSSEYGSKRILITWESFVNFYVGMNLPDLPLQASAQVLSGGRKLDYVHEQGVYHTLDARFDRVR